jgi:glutaredoxin
MPRFSKQTSIILTVAAILFIYVLFFSAEADQGTDFRGRTEQALKRKHSIMSGDISDEDLLAQTQEQLQQILHSTNSDSAPSDTTDEIAVAGRKTMPNPRVSPYQQASTEKPKYPLADEDADRASSKSVADPGEDMAREELMRIFKKSPMIIFSKSYCPHSKRAKQLLLHMYDIKPEPLVVELDQMTQVVPSGPATSDEDEHHDHDVTLGRKMQDVLASMTSRRTVPNIMVNMQSIGGASEVVAMSHEGTLIEKIKELGGKKITSIKQLEEAD